MAKTDVDGLQVQEVSWNRPGQRLIIVRQRIDQRPQAGGKELIEVPGYRFHGLITNLSALGAVVVWRKYTGRADM